MQFTKHKPLSVKTAKHLTLISVFLLGTLSSAKVLADIRQHLEQRAHEYVLQNAAIDNAADLSVNANSIDSRIDIPVCRSPYQLYASDASLRQSNVSVKISCPDNNWYLFTNVQVVQTKPVVVVSSILSPGTLLTSANVQLADMPIGRLRGSTFSDTSEIIGARLKRRVRPGQVVGDNMLCFVCKGDKVTILAAGSGLQIKASGIAKQDGNLGDTISVENISSKKTVSARVASTSQVNIEI